MVLWINALQNNNFINPTWLPLLCRNSGAIHIAQPGLAGRQADKIQVNFEFLKFTIDQNF